MRILRKEAWAETSTKTSLEKCDGLPGPKGDFAGAARQPPRSSGRSICPGPRLSEKTEPKAKGSRFSPHFLPFTLERIDSSYRHLHLLNVLDVCERMREVLRKECSDLDSNLAEAVGGCAKGPRRIEPQVAFVPLASVGHPQADGRLLGMGLAVRENIMQHESRYISAALDRIRKDGFRIGKFGKWRIQPNAAGRPAENLRPDTWTSHPQGATEWATVTPISFDRHVETEGNAAHGRELESIIRLACRHAAVPEPCEVIVTPVSTHFGAPPANAFPRFREEGSERRHSHAVLIFAEPVRGPILLGAARHCGYGLCRPMLDEA
jgi:CRISPR-associated protein Csb2